jgi:hypothetical protein
MPDHVMHILHCSKCDEAVAWMIVVPSDAPAETPTKCFHGHVSTVGEILSAMQMANLTPRRLEDFLHKKPRRR